MQLDQERIRLRAYEIWQREGCPAGRDDDHWKQAELELRSEASADGAVVAKGNGKSAPAKARKADAKPEAAKPQAAKPETVMAAAKAPTPKAGAKAKAAAPAAAEKPAARKRKKADDG